MAGNIDERIPENLFTNMMIEKATIIRDHLKCKQDTCPLIMVANIGPIVAVFKFYDTTKEDNSLKLRMTLSNMGVPNEQLRILWQQVNFLLQEYCSHCGHNNSNSSCNSHQNLSNE